VLSAESRTSNVLVQVLNREYWKREITFIAPSQTSPGDPSTGYLHIGDICFEKEREYQYRIDLGQEWKSWTGLPFAFACWVSLGAVPAEVTKILNHACASGIDHIGDLELSDRVKQYLQDNISYHYDEHKGKALQLFLNKAKTLTNPSLQSAIT
jgi:chorismate dehydratase